MKKEEKNLKKSDCLVDIRGFLFVVLLYFFVDSILVYMVCVF